MSPLTSVSQDFLRQEFQIHLSSFSQVLLGFTTHGAIPGPMKNSVSRVFPPTPPRPPSPRQPTFAVNADLSLMAACQFPARELMAATKHCFENFRVLKPLVWGSLPLKSCHNSRPMEIKNPFKATAMKVENRAFLRMSRYLVMNAQNGCVLLVFGKNLSRLGNQGGRRMSSSVSQPGVLGGVGQVLG